MLRFEAEPAREPIRLTRGSLVTAEVLAELARLAPVARPDGFVLVAPPCGCDFCSSFGTGSQWTAEQVEDFAARARGRIMAGVDMPGRIVDDVRPDQRGES